MYHSSSKFVNSKHPLEKFIYMYNNFVSLFKSFSYIIILLYMFFFLLKKAFFYVACFIRFL